MKKIILALLLSISIFTLFGCSLTSKNSPTDTVKEFLDKYKKQDPEVLSNLDDTISSEYTGDNKERYKTLMINQYKNMEYEITDEIIDGNTALVTAKITVLDYSNAIEEANDYLSKHEEEFKKKSSDETNDNNSSIKNNIDNEKFLDYKLDILENVSDITTNTIEFSLTKEKDGWKMDSLTDTDIEKIHGIYKE